MENEKKLFLPPPNFSKKVNEPPKAHYLTPSGMTLLTRERQPPPMYGPRGATIPAKFLQQHKPITNERAPQNIEREFCFDCEMELERDEDLRLHRLKHVPCPINDCQYRGHPTIMDKHIASLHASGLFEKIKKLNTPEEIAAWREERRKRYPSVANVALQQKAREQRQQRGERLEPSKHRFGKPEERRRIATPYTVPNNKEGKNTEQQVQSDSNVHRKLSYKEKRRAAKKKRAAAIIKLEKAVVVEGSTAPQEFMFKGTSKMKDYKHAQPKKKMQSNPLTNLLGMYGSDDEDDSDCGTKSNDSANEAEAEDATIVEKNDNEELNCDQYAANQQPDDSVEAQLTTCDMEQSQTEVIKLTVEETKQCTEVDAQAQSTKTEIAAESMIANHDTPNDITQDKLSSKTNDLMHVGVPKTSLEDSAEITKAPLLQRPCVTNKENANASSDEAPEEAAIQRVSNMPVSAPKTNTIPATTQSGIVKPAQKKFVKERFKRKLGLDYSKAKLRKPHSMLERLLEPDIRHERNVLLQCVRYVVSNNFFDVSKPKIKTTFENTNEK